MISKKEARKKLNKIIEKKNIFKKQERQGQRKDWTTMWWYTGIEDTLKYILEEGELEI